MKKLTVIRDGLELSMKGPRGVERLKIKSGHPETLFSKSLFSNLGVMHLIAPYLPEVVETNFRLTRHWTGLIKSMYAFSNRHHPKFKHANQGFYFESDSVDLSRYKVEKLFPDFHKRPGCAVVAYSAGKDSMWNLWHAQEEYGKENVLAVHVSGLNKGVASDELAYCKRQSAELGFRLTVIEMVNSSKNTGYQVMRSRDMFLAGLVIPYALKFGASEIITEGFAETDDNKEPFSGQERNMKYFNFMLKEFGIPVQITWKNRKEMDILKDLVVHKPDWLPHVYNCFSVPCYRGFLKRSWKKRTPTFYMYDSQCGSCVKCRIINLGRLLYGSEKISDEDAKYFVKNTIRWAREKMPTHADFIEGSFMRDLRRAAKRYGVVLETG